MPLRVKLHAAPSAASAAEPPHEIDVAEDDWLMDVCDASSAPLLFSCRSGECGICALVVLSGAAALDPPTEREIATLQLRLPGADPRTRLGCRCRILASGADPNGVVELRMLRT